MKKKFLSILLIALTLIAALSSCSDNDGKTDPFENPDAGKDQISYIVAIKEPSGETRSTNVASDEGVPLGSALEKLGHIESKDGVLTKVFNYSLEQFQTPGYDLKWQISVNGTVTDQDAYSIMPQKNTVYTFEMIFTVNGAPIN